MFRGVMTELQHQYAAGLEQLCRLRDQRRVDFRAGFAAEKRDGGLVLADFAWQRRRFLAADVGRVAGDEIEGAWLVTRDS